MERRDGSTNRRSRLRSQRRTAPEPRCRWSSSAAAPEKGAPMRSTRQVRAARSRRALPARSLRYAGDENILGSEGRGDLVKARRDVDDGLHEFRRKRRWNAGLYHLLQRFRRELRERRNERNQLVVMRVGILGCIVNHAGKADRNCAMAVDPRAECKPGGVDETRTDCVERLSNESRSG